MNNRYIDDALRLLRELNDGAEPYAPMVWPTARALSRYASGILLEVLGPVRALAAAELEKTNPQGPLSPKATVPLSKLLEAIAEGEARLLGEHAQLGQQLPANLDRVVPVKE